MYSVRTKYDLMLHVAKWLVRLVDSFLVANAAWRWYHD